MPAVPVAFRLESGGLPLLKTWCDGLLARQVARGDDRGGFLCPATGRVPGRCADAVQPLLALHRHTGDARYRQAAVDVFDWAERHVSQTDGSWLNEIDSDWKGTTAFGVIALGEALRHDGAALPAGLRERWTARLRRAADYLFAHMTFETGDINYPLSTAASLAIAAAVLEESKYLPRSREFAHFALRHQTTRGLIWGEGERGPADVSPRGLPAIDLTYNVEETLPNLALYAELTGDTAIEQFVIDALRAHLPFLLPDGAWDAGWCSRQYKWCYWGGATCDGSVGVLWQLREHDGRFAEAAARNLELLRSCTHDGLLHAGPGLHARGLPPLLHHTFVRAKTLAVALHAGPTAGHGESSVLHPSAALPADVADGLEAWPEAAVVRFARGDWRGTVTVNDIPQSAKRGGQPSGGALVLLWHAAIGPVCVAGMNDYVRYEGRNMQPPAAADTACPTPRIEWRVGGAIYSNVYDRAAVLEQADCDGRIDLRVSGTLRNRQGERPHCPADYELSYQVTSDDVTIGARLDCDGATLEVPIVSPAGERVLRPEGTTVVIEKQQADLHALSSGGVLRSDDTPRAFAFVPGVEAVPLRLALVRGQVAGMTLTVRRR